MLGKGKRYGNILNEGIKCYVNEKNWKKQNCLQKICRIVMRFIQYRCNENYSIKEKIILGNRSRDVKLIKLLIV